MENKINWENINMCPLTEKIKYRMVAQLIKKQIEINFLGDIEKIEKFSDECSLCMDKLNFAEKANLMNPNDYKKYLEIIEKIGAIDYVDEMKKIKMILSYGVLVNYFGDINKLKDEEIILLSACSTELDKEDYTYYIGILSNETVVSEIISASPNFDDQLNLCYDIMNSQSEFPFNFITADNYDILVQNGLEVVNKYNDKHIKKLNLL